MKRLFFLMLVASFVLASTTINAAEKYPLGNGDVAVKLDYIHFEDECGDLNIDGGLFVGLEGYTRITPNLYLGMEAGYMNSDDEEDLDVPLSGTFHANTELTYIPVELNLKLVKEAAPNFIISFGAGISYNYAEGEVSVSALDLSEEESEWLFGGQFFAELNYKINQFFIGINAKYQITEDFELEDIDVKANTNNLRIGGQIGIIF